MHTYLNLVHRHRKCKDKSGKRKLCGQGMNQVSHIHRGKFDSPKLCSHRLQDVEITVLDNRRAGQRMSFSLKYIIVSQQLLVFKTEWSLRSVVK